VTPLAALGLATFRLGQLSPAAQHLAEALASALTHNSVVPALATLPAIALVLATNGDKVRAVEIWALAKSHPFVANSKWFGDAAGRELEVLAASLLADAAAAASATGRELDLWETVKQILTELS
jgi:hypothetical protein